MKVVALDLSLTATGWATSIDGLAVQAGVLRPNGRRGFERLDWIRAEVLGLVHTADLVVIEGYAMYTPKGRHSHVRETAELGGVIRMAFHDLGYTWVDVPPATLKRVATGKGNAAKELVLVEAVKRLGYQGADHNESDALWLLEAALQHYGLGTVELPKARREALAKVEWPASNECAK